MSLSRVDIRVMLASEWVRKFSFWFYLPKETIENWYNFFLKCLVEFTSEPIWGWCFGRFGRLLIIDSISLKGGELFRHLCMSFGCVFQGVGPFNLGYQICGHWVVHNITFYPFNIHGISGDDHSFISDIGDLYVFFVFS